MKYKHSEEIAVIGLGRFGQAVVEQLIKLGKSITIIDEDEDKLKIYADDVERLIVGDAAETKLLKSIGIEKFGTVVVAVPENIDIISALLELKVKNIIGRAIDRRRARILKQIGVDVIVRPEYETGIRTALIAANPNFYRFSQNLQELGDDFVLGTTIVKNKNICQKAIKDLDLNNRGINIVLIKTNGKNHRPVGNSFINEGDVVTVIGQTHDVTSAFEWFNDTSTKNTNS
ncbi:TrkA family potassium uptake protein [Mycoplasmopsis felis]|uniref:Potassium transporter Trk n=1 Tax=Mycoplasmopsis felis TaxID=33923 RepID=A0A809SEN5_9BACT|nr:TrkA family potassium uptake protein [Mycoplasmopsis felis]WQQ01909.1 TrkA family potassium uptake protein [Mycoplasmopsis felis]WQQ02354.1 TrkA family potassium uptake protein [Mycoplasmopsis felis]WQQ03414.1 TrkA family potassium uptake protein [Mycoplasmopsis felis]WQQ04295.1 TrkA family potassium uptake protein [Mycoplasmopsis felis]WQQ05675.1 TrkA family potassium uptake protein [Mycoplasmopsis felis]